MGNKKFYELLNKLDKLLTRAEDNLYYEELSRKQNWCENCPYYKKAKEEANRK